MTPKLQKWCALLCWLPLAGALVAAQEAARVKCEHAAPPRGTHYVCDDPQNPCYCRVEPDNPDVPPGDYAQNPAAPDRKVWIDPRRKIYYCSEKKPAKLPKHYLRLTEEEATRHGYKPASQGRCQQAEGGHK